jgi:hypothetical protein
MAALLDTEHCSPWSYVKYNNRVTGGTLGYQRTYLYNAAHPDKSGYMMIADMIIADIVERFQQ